MLAVVARGARDRERRAGADRPLRDRRLELAAADRLGRGRRDGELVRVREGHRGHDVHRPDLPAQPVGLDGARDALRRVPHGPPVGLRPTRRSSRARSRRPTTSSRSRRRSRASFCPVLDVEYDGGLSVPRLTLWVQTWLGQVVARTGLKPLVYVSPSFWKTKLGDSPVVAAAGPSALDRALDGGRAADPAGRELGWARLVVLAVEQLPEDRRDQRLRRRRPVQRLEPRERHRPRLPGRGADADERPDDRRRPAGREAARRSSREPGAAASRSRSRTSGRAATPPAAPAPRSRPRRRSRTRRPRPTSGIALLVRVSAVTAGGNGVGLVRRDPRRRGLGGAGRHRTEGPEAARRSRAATRSGRR